VLICSGFHATTRHCPDPGRDGGRRLRVGEDIARGASVAVVFEAAIQDGSKTASVEVPGTAIWARLEGLSFQVGVHFEESPMWLLEILSVLS
jgi:hypothetical protein